MEKAKKGISIYWGGVGVGAVKVEVKRKDGNVKTTRLKNLGEIESGGGLVLLFVFWGGLRYGNSNTIAFLFGV